MMDILMVVETMRIDELNSRKTCRIKRAEI